MMDQDHPNAKIGKAVVDHINSGAEDAGPLWDKHWHPDFVSVEGDGREWAGRAAVEEKHKEWSQGVKMHSCTAHGPYITPAGFCVRFDIDCEAADGSWPRMQVDEVGVYTVKDGKVVREEFYARPMACQSSK